MSRYEPLWNWIQENGEESFRLTSAEIEHVAGVPLDHSFLKYKKEMQEYGYQVRKISMKTETVALEKLPV